MARIVQKYGGSSVADLDRIRRVADRVAADHGAGHELVVVVSAMGNTTNELLALARELVPQPDPRELDMLASVGERITMALLAMALGARGVPARSLTGSQAGLVTDERHADAKVVEVRPQRLEKVLAAGEVAIVAGFQGVSREREVTTLGRGGSDTTAVVLAAALKADWCTIASDVDGVWSADPRVVPEAVQLPELPLDTALALAAGGAKVLFEDAVRYARDHGVVLRAVEAFGPGAGTRLTPTSTGPRVVGVTADAHLVRLDGERGGPVPIEGLVSSFVEAGCRVRRWAEGGERVHVWLDTRHVVGEGGFEGPAATAGATVAATATVTSAGSGIGEDHAATSAGTEALGSAGVGVRSLHASGDAIVWEVAPERCDDAVRAVHRALVGSGRRLTAPGRAR